MRIDSVASIKNKNRRTRRGKERKVRELAPLPSEGSLARRVYDQLFADNGKEVELKGLEGTHRGAIGAAIVALSDFYGMDIRHFSKSKYILAGEWCGRVYIDYVVERMNENDKKR